MRREIKEGLGKALYTILIVVVSILFYFFMERFQGFATGVGVVTSIVRPFIVGGCIAYLLIPVNDWIVHKLSKLFKVDQMNEAKAEKLKKTFGTIGSVVSILLFVSVIFAFFSMMIPQMVESVSSIVMKIPDAIMMLDKNLKHILEGNQEIAQVITDNLNAVYDNVVNNMTENMNEKLNALVNGISTGVISMTSFLKDFLIGIIVALYVMGNRKTFLRQVKLLVLAIFPRKENREGKEQTADWIFRETSILNSYMNGFIKGKIVDSAIIGVICLVFTIVTGMPYAMLVSVIIGVTNIIPFFGPFIGAIPTALIILMVSPMKCLIFVIFIIVLQQLDGNVIGPYILGNATNLSSFWVLFAILFFGGLFGIPGMILGVPIFGFIYQLIKEIVYKRVDKQAQIEKVGDDEIQD